MKKWNLVFALLLPICAQTAKAQYEELDSVAAIVDDSVVLTSEVADMVSGIKKQALKNGQSLPSDQSLRTQVLDRLINQALQLQLAKRMGLQISDAQLDQTLTTMAAEQGKTLEDLRAQVIADGDDYEKYREDVRNELITGEVSRINVRRRVYISPQEITNLVQLLTQEGEKSTEYKVGHILVGFESRDVTPQLLESTKTRAERVLELLNNGNDFKRTALASSSGPKALEGGDLGWLNINEMPTLFAEAIKSKDKGVLIGPLRSGAGFHILKVEDIRGEQKVEVEEIKSRHILIKPSIILSDDKAKEMLQEFRDKILADPEQFAVLAKEHSEDPGSGSRGGDLGWADPNIYVPAFKLALSNLKKDEISQPFRSSHGWHIVQLLDKRTQDATDKRISDKAYRLLFNRKYSEESVRWLREIRDQAYVEIPGKE